MLVKACDYLFLDRPLTEIVFKEFKERTGVILERYGMSNWYDFI